MTGMRYAAVKGIRGCGHIGYKVYPVSLAAPDQHLQFAEAMDVHPSFLGVSPV